MKLAELPCFAGGNTTPKTCVHCEKREGCGLDLPEAYLSDKHLTVVRGNVCLPKRAKESHKGDYGKLLILGGSVGYTGAPSLCARAAVRAGAGLVSLGVPQDIYAIEAVKNDEAMPFPLPSDDKGRIAPSAMALLTQKTADKDVIAAGPGLGRSEGVQTLVRWLLDEWTKPLVLDADALWALSKEPERLKNTAAQVVLTPHEGEFTRLYSKRSGDRLCDARAFAEQYGCTLVLKGHRTLIAFPDGEVCVVAAGNPGMAKGGSGDVLTGVLGAMLGQLPFREAVVTGCWLHARAGDLVAQAMGEYAMTATDITVMLAPAMLEIIDH